MHVYVIGRSASSAPRQHRQNSKHRRYSTAAWDRIQDAINREHRGLAASDPRSPRIRPSLASLVEEGVR